MKKLLFLLFLITCASSNLKARKLSPGQDLVISVVVLVVIVLKRYGVNIPKLILSKVIDDPLYTKDVSLSKLIHKVRFDIKDLKKAETLKKKVRERVEEVKQALNELDEADLNAGIKPSLEKGDSAILIDKALRLLDENTALNRFGSLKTMPIREFELDMDGIKTAAEAKIKSIMGQVDIDRKLFVNQLTNEDMANAVLEHLDGDLFEDLWWGQIDNVVLKVLMNKGDTLIFKISGESSEGEVSSITEIDSTKGFDHIVNTTELKLEGFFELD